MPSCNPDRTEVGNATQHHFYLARPHRRKSRVIQTLIARSYFRSIPQQLESLLGRKEQGPEGQGCWYEVDPVQQEGSKINIYICIQIHILGMHMSMSRHQTCPVHLHTRTQPNSHTCIRTHIRTTKLPHTTTSLLPAAQAQQHTARDFPMSD